MFDSSRTPKDCSKWRIGLEDCFRDDYADAEPGPVLSAHLMSCADCREAWQDALVSRRLMRTAVTSAVQPSGAFVTRVMSSIREAQDRERLSIWRPLELLASRFALAAAALLLVLSLYLAAFAPTHPLFANRTQAEIGPSMPEPPAQPANQDETLMSLAEAPNGN